MPKSSNLNVRIEPEIKERAEEILASLGLTSSGAINLFYSQIILRGGLPFEVRLPASPRKSFYDMTEEEQAAEIQKGVDDAKNGRTKPADEVFAGIKSKYEL